MNLIKQKLLYASGRGGLTMYWAIIIGVIIMSGYLVGDMIPSRKSPNIQGEQLVAKEPKFTDSYAGLQLRTFTFTGCQGAPAVQFLLDVSGSMDESDIGGGGSKFQALKRALTLFGETMSNQGLVGISTFADVPKEELPLAPIKEIRSDYNDTISRLEADGFTFMKDGMTEVEKALMRTKSEYQNRNMILILVSDGIPESRAENDRCRLGGVSCNCANVLGLVNYRCFYSAQDPTREPNVAQRIKDMGVKIYTIGIQSESGSDVYFRSDFNTLLSRVASEPTNRYYIRANRAAELPSIFENISQNLCTEES